MNILADNPVLRREARRWLRLRWLVKNKAVAWPVGVCLAYFYWRGLVAFLNGADVESARAAWSDSLFVVLWLIVLLAPTLSANAISQEREQQTWETLGTTPLTAGQVLLGKWLARLVPVGLFVLLVLPPLLVCGFIGDVSWAVEWVVLVFFLATAGFYGLVGLTCSFLAGKTITAISLSVIVTVLLCLGTYILVQLITAVGLEQDYFEDYLLWGNPFYVLTNLMRWLFPDQSGIPPYAPIIVGTYFGMILRTYAVGSNWTVGFCKYSRIASRMRFALAA